MERILLCTLTLYGVNFIRADPIPEEVSASKPENRYAYGYDPIPKAQYYPATDVEYVTDTEEPFLYEYTSQPEVRSNYGSGSTVYTYRTNMDDFVIALAVALSVIALLNIIINYFTLMQCVSIKQPVNRWYRFYALSQAASLRYTFNTLRNENEMLYEQIYLLIKHLKNSDNKHIIVINRNAIENEAKYDYARFSGYLNMKTPNIYEAPFDMKKYAGIVEEQG